MRFKKQSDTKKTIKLSEKEKEYVSLVYGSEKQFNETIQNETARVRNILVNELRSYGLSGRNKTTEISKVERRTVIEGFQESGYINFNGVKINTSQDVADLYTLHRSPYIEKAHLSFT